MRWRKAVQGLALILGILSALSMPARAADGASGFIASLGQQALTIIRSNEAQDERQRGFATLFTEGFDVPAIGRFVLGRYWRVATPEQQSRYLDLFGRYVIAIYSARFSNYSGEGFDVVGEQPGENGAVLVTSLITRPDGGQPLHINWRVNHLHDAFKITDVIVEGVSMSVTQRQEFSSVIAQNGGKVQALLDMLEKRAGG